MLSLQDSSRQQPRVLLLCCVVHSAGAGESSSSGAGADRGLQNPAACSDSAHGVLSCTDLGTAAGTAAGPGCYHAAD